MLTKGSKEVTIAVIDGQFLPKNGAFSQGQCDAKYELIDLTGGRLSLGYHGEEVASLISTCENNPLNLIGINRYSTVLWINNIHPPGILLNDLLLWANGDRNICKNSKKISCTFPNTQPADILNVSLGGPGLYPKTARMLYLPLAEQINSQSRMLVASAGNDSKSADLYFPTSATGVISAGSTAENGMAAAHSNWGETVEIMAPGENVPVAYLLGKALDSGTSFAAPIIAGVISLMRSVNPNLNWKTAVYFLQSTAVPMDCHAYCIANRDSKAQAECSKDCCKGNTQTCTPGRVDAGAAVAAAKKAVTEGLPQVALIDADKYWTGIKRELYWTGTKLEKREGRKGSVRIFNVGGGKGKYKITSPDGGLLFAGSQKELEVELAAQGHPGDSLNLDFVTTTLFDEEAAIRIASPESGVLSSFSDEIVLYVGDDIFSP
ncbi:MAG TPA: S8 family serine peptidase [Myxococcota bacterium]|nr:S8 family serine peptidase [Myxococcota bacterium]